MYDKSNNEKARARIDSDCVTLVVGVKWYQRPDGYVATNNYRGNGYTYLHSVILDKFSISPVYVDHKDGNRLNNTRSNLRLATPSQNGMNKRIRSNNTSGRVGVHWSKDNEKWCSMISINGKHINLGYSDSLEEAIARRSKAEKKYFGEFRAEESRVRT